MIAELDFFDVGWRAFGRQLKKVNKVCLCHVDVAQHFWLCSGVSCDVRNAIRNPFTDQKKHVFVHARHGWNWMDMVLVSPCKSVHQDSFGDLENLQGISTYFRDISRG